MGVDFHTFAIFFCSFKNHSCSVCRRGRLIRRKRRDQTLLTPFRLPIKSLNRPINKQTNYTKKDGEMKLVINSYFGNCFSHFFFFSYCGFVVDEKFRNYRGYFENSSGFLSDIVVGWEWISNSVPICFCKMAKIPAWIGI